MGERTAREVLDDHLSMSLGGCVEEDVTRNYAEDVTVLSNWGVEQGHDGVRRLAALLQAQLPDCVFTYTLRLVEGEVGLLVWDADSAAGSVRGGVDSYVIRGGRIQAQTIHYDLGPSRA